MRQGYLAGAYPAAAADHPLRGCPVMWTAERRPAEQARARSEQACEGMELGCLEGISAFEIG